MEWNILMWHKMSGTVDWHEAYINFWSCQKKLDRLAKNILGPVEGWGISILSKCQNCSNIFVYCSYFFWVKNFEYIFLVQPNNFTMRANPIRFWTMSRPAEGPTRLKLWNCTQIFDYCSRVFWVKYFEDIFTVQPNNFTLRANLTRFWTLRSQTRPKLWNCTHAFD